MSWFRVLPLLLCPLRLTAGEPALSLDAAVELALGTTPELVVPAAELDAARALTVSAGRLPDPALVLGLDNLPVNGPDAYSTSRDFMTMRRIGLMQEFPRSAKRKLERERAVAEAEVAELQLLDAQLVIARETAQAWLRRATAERSLAQLRQLAPEVQLQAAAARGALAAGRSTGAEALAAEAAIAELDSRLLALESEARGAEAELARWIEADAKRPLAPMPDLDRLPMPASELLAKVDEHGALRPYEARIEAAQLDVELAREERRPDFSAELSFAKRGPDFSDMVSLQVRVDLPLFTRTRQDPAIRARHARVRGIEAAREAQRRMHVAQLRRMILDWELLGARLDHYERQLLPLARERSRAALASYRAGRGDLKPALDAHEREIAFVLEQAALLEERARAWVHLRYQHSSHL